MREVRGLLQREKEPWLDAAWCDGTACRSCADYLWLMDGSYCYAAQRAQCNFGCPISTTPHAQLTLVQ